MNTIAPLGHMERYIYFIRDQRVMLDVDLAHLYGVVTGHLNRAVKRNQKRFPPEFMFQLTKTEYQTLRCQIGILEKGPHAKYLPYVFTQEGVAMLSSVLKTDRAITANVEIMKAFFRLRDLLSTHKDLYRKLEQLEMKYDKQFKVVFDAIRNLMDAPIIPFEKKHRKPPVVKGFTAKA